MCLFRSADQKRLGSLLMNAATVIAQRRSGLMDDDIAEPQLDALGAEIGQLAVTVANDSGTKALQSEIKGGRYGAQAWYRAANKQFGAVPGSQREAAAEYDAWVAKVVGR